VLPLSLQYGYEVVEKFLKGLNNCDSHFNQEAAQENVPILLGLIGFYNTHICEFNSRAILPYC